MKPLQLIAVGLVVIALRATLAGSYDLFANPLGWVLVLLAMPAFRREGERRLLVAGLVAFATSVALYVPAARDWLDPRVALLWATELPWIVFSGLLCYLLARRAREYARTQAQTRGLNPAAAAAGWLRLTAGLLVVTGLAPVLVFGAGLAQLATASGVLTMAVRLLVIILMLIYAGRPWAPSAAEALGETDPHHDRQ